MKLSKTWKIVIGILTILQLFIGLFLLVWMFTSFLPMIINNDPEMVKSTLVASLGGFVLGVAVLSLLSLGVLVFYLIHAGTNRQISNTMKVIWIILLFFFTSIAPVVYFFMEVAPERSLTGKLESN